MRHLNNGTDHRHSKSCCDQSSPARRTIIIIPFLQHSTLYRDDSLSRQLYSKASTLHECHGISNHRQADRLVACSSFAHREIHQWPVDPPPPPPHHPGLTLYVLFFFRENINIYLHFMSFLHTNKTQAVEIPPRVRHGPAYSTWSISWLPMSWRRKEPGHQQPWYWPS